MFNRLKTLTASGLVALAALAAVPASAQADSFYFGLGGGRGGPDVEFRFGERGGRHWDRDDRGGRHWDGGGRHWDRGRDRGPRGCTVGQALRKADRMGINRVHVRGENRNVIRIGGRERGRNVVVAFARVPGCPVIR